MASTYLMLIDLDSCSGCHACSVACKAEHRAPTNTFRHTVQYVENGAFPNVKRRFVPTLCQHCEDPPCLDACPTSSIFQKEDGSVIINQESCIGAGTCVDACPYGAIYLDPSTGLADKCDFCESRVEVGGTPACAATCPTDAILFGYEEEESIQQALKRGSYSHWEREGTKPRVWYKGLDQVTESKLTCVNDSEGEH